CEQTGAVERRVAIDLRERDLRHDGVLRKCRRPHEVADRLALAREPRGAVGGGALVSLLRGRRAEGRPGGGGGRAPAGRWGEARVNGGERRGRTGPRGAASRTPSRTRSTTPGPSGRSTGGA